MKLEQLSELMQGLTREEEKTILRGVATYVFGNHMPEMPTAYDYKDYIIERERRGETGFDCGWVTFEMLDEELNSEITALANATYAERSKYAGLSISSIYITRGGVVGVLPNLIKNPIHCQSTTIQRALGACILEYLIKVHPELSKQLRYTSYVRLD